MIRATDLSPGAAIAPYIRPVGPARQEVASAGESARPASWFVADTPPVLIVAGLDAVATGLTVAQHAERIVQALVDTTDPLS